MIRDLHAQVKDNIERKVGQYQRFANKDRKEVTFKEGDCVWLHLRKERFPTQRKSKLHLREASNSTSLSLFFISLC